MLHEKIQRIFVLSEVCRKDDFVDAIDIGDIIKGSCAVPVVDIYQESNEVEDYDLDESKLV